MVKRNKLSLFLSSIAVMAIAASILAGGTYALFSSESKVNIAITSGKVDVTATIDAYSVSKSETSSSDFTASISDGSTLNISKINPGDSVSFNIKITNESNIIVKYRAEVTQSESGDTDLFNALTCKFGDDDTSNSKVGAWKTLTLNSEKEFTLSCTVSLPTSSSNTYQDKACGLIYSIKAIQGNFNTD